VLCSGALYYTFVYTRDNPVNIVNNPPEYHSRPFTAKIADAARQNSQQAEEAPK